MIVTFVIGGKKSRGMKMFPFLALLLETSLPLSLVLAVVMTVAATTTTRRGPMQAYPLTRS